MRSSTSSHPTVSRRSPSAIPACSSSPAVSWRWLVEAGMRDRLDAAQAGRPQAQRDAVHDRLAAGAAAVHLEGRGRRTRPGCASRPRARMRGQARVEHARTRGWACRNAAMAAALADARSSRRCSVRIPRRTSQAESGEQGRAGVERALGQLADQIGRPGGDAREHVGVAVQVLGRGVEDEVGAVLERPAVDRGGDGVVDHELRPAAWAISASGGRSATARCGVRDGLDERASAAPATAVRTAARSAMSTSRPSGRAEAMWWVWP